MSGWIKLEKDLREDVRVRRISRELVTHLRYNPAMAVTLVVGGLAQLWMHADSFARQDDTLEITTAEIDELTGIQGFAKLLPRDWLEILDTQTVKLPGFQEHNGSEAKRRALTSKRVSHHRAANANAQALQAPKDCNAPALPDQTRPDQTKTNPKNPPAPRAAKVNGASHSHPDSARFELIERLKAEYPPGLHRGDHWLHAERAVAKLLDAEDATPERLIAATQAYRAQQQALGTIGTAKILRPNNFYGTAAWIGPFPVPASSESEFDRMMRINTPTETVTGSVRRLEGTGVVEDPSRDIRGGRPEAKIR